MRNPFLYVFSFCFKPYEVGMFNPFLYSFSFCFIRYEVGLCNPFNIFLLLFYMLRCKYGVQTGFYPFKRL